MPQSYSAVYVHLVFSTLGRQPLLRDKIFRGEMHSVLGRLSGKLGCPTVLVGGVEDHVHLLARLGRQVCQSDWAKELKRQSTNWANDRTSGFQWQRGFGAFSVGHREVPEIRRYIERQEHHRTVTFQEEFLALLDEHEIDYDLRYIWE